MTEKTCIEQACSAWPKSCDMRCERPPTASAGYVSAQGYFGHDLGCDCAVYEDITQRDLSRKLNADNIELIKQLAYQMGFAAAKRKIIAVIEIMPGRVEPISGQNFTYVQRGEAIAAMQQVEI